MPALEMPTEVSFLVKPASYACNLDCDYCFYKRVREIYSERKPFMAFQTAEAMIKKALSLGATRNVFSWQGGEPTLLGLHFFKDIIALQETYRQPHQIVENTLQTNGILIDQKWCRFLRGSKVLVGVSLDGPETMHNRYRKFSNGKGSFDRVMNNIALMRKNRVKFNILTLLTDANVGEPESLYRFFRKNRFSHLQFINCFEVDPVTGGLTDCSVHGNEVGQFYCALFDLWLKDGFPYVSIRFFEDVLIYYFDRVHVSCPWMERCGSYIVIEHNGDAYPCDFFVYPEWKLGNIVTDDLRSLLASPLRKTFGDAKVHLPEPCRTCEVVSFCNGDCTRVRPHHKGVVHGGRSEYCIALKMLLEHMSPHMPMIEQKVMEFRSERRPPPKPGRLVIP